MKRGERGIETRLDLIAAGNREVHITTRPAISRLSVLATAMGKLLPTSKKPMIQDAHRQVRKTAGTPLRGKKVVVAIGRSFRAGEATDNPSEPKVSIFVALGFIFCRNRLVDYRVRSSISWSSLASLARISRPRIFLSSQFYASSKPRSAPKLVSVSNQVTATIRAVEKVSDILDDMIAAGANNVWKLEFLVSDPSKALDEARRSAVTDERRKAELYVDAAGVALGPVCQSSNKGPRCPHRWGCCGLGVLWWLGDHCQLRRAKTHSG